MSNRLLAAWLPLSLLACGCVGDTRSPLLSGGAVGQTTPPMRPDRAISKAPPTEATGQRVLELGQKIVLANPQMGLRPVFVTVGTPQPEIFHKGGQLEGYSVFISEGLVNRCPDDAQLAAVLCLELGKIITEREALAGPKLRQLADRPPPSESIGSDSGGTFGSSDGTRLMELAKYDQKRRQTGSAPPPPQPDVLARKYLTQAGFDPGALADVAGVLRQAEDTFNVERQLGGRASEPRAK